MKHSPVILKAATGIALYGLCLLAASFVDNAYALHVLILSSITAVLVMSHNLVTGYVGLFHLCHAAFYAIGAYVSALLAMKAGAPVPLSILLGAVGAALAGLVVGLMTIRFGGHYLAIVTLGFGIIVFQVLNNWVDLTRGPMGLSGIPLPSPINLFGMSITWTPHAFLALGLALVIVAYLVFARIRDSKIGLMMKAIRENELAGAFVGIRTMRFKVAAFAISAFFAGAAGAVYAHYSQMIVPELFNFGVSADLIAMTVLGGLGSFGGSIASAAFFTIVPEMLRVAGQWRLTVFGLLVVLVVLFFPKGMAGLWDLAWSAIRGLVRHRPSEGPGKERKRRGIA